MTKQKLEILQQYHYGKRGVLRAGDRFRVSGGPIYVTDAGREFPLRERGVLVFQRFCVRGAARWIEATHGNGGMVVLWVGRAGRSPTVPNLRRRPYRIRSKLRVSDARQRRKPP